ncbi:MAG: Gfo/Idh/MocA family oxidoreductase [Bryobacterales bacterium]|nr:Gfo/Idh/MocA family oxidoreductase [Bryobacterales bacterium]
MSETAKRRDFIKSAGAAAAVAGFTILRPSAVRGSQANSALTVGLVGAGRRGSYVAGLFAKNEFARVSQICDIYDDQIAEASKRFSGARTFKNIDDLLASDVDAVLIATPPYLHPEHFEKAVKARKHIFMEKPAAVDAAGCRRVMEAARRADKTRRITVDYQQRYGKDYRRAYEIVKSGQLGAIRTIRAAWIGGGLPVRKGHPQSEERVRNWLFYRELSGDILVEQNCHNLDVVNWFTGKHPVRAFGYGGRAVRKDIGDIMDNLAATYIFDDGMVFSYAANQISVGFRDVSETFMCEKGSVTTSRQGYTIHRSSERGAQPEVVQTQGDITQDAVNEFVEGARTGKIENAGVSAAESTLVAIMAREAIYAGRELTWDGVMRM